MEIYVGTKYRVSKTTQVNVKGFKNDLSALASVSPVVSNPDGRVEHYSRDA
jgi:hypothetical protein